MAWDNNNNMSQWLVRLLNHADVSSYMLSLATAIKIFNTRWTLPIRGYLNKHFSQHAHEAMCSKRDDNDDKNLIMLVYLSEIYRPGCIS